MKSTVRSRRSILFYAILFVFGYHNLSAQCDFITPPKVKKINYASREVTFSNVTINGKKTTYLAVKKGEKVKISTRVEANRKGNYCPDCIVQIYWGINGYVSTCAKSFHGYQFNKKKSTLKFRAPTEDGIYYITMGGTLDYSCKNNKDRPNCPAEDAFAVIKVGNPDPEQSIRFEKVNKGTKEFLKSTLVKTGCFGDLDKLEWFLDDHKLAFDNREEIPLTKLGTYKAVWSSCLESASDTYYHTDKEKKVIKVSLIQDSEPSGGTDISDLIKNNDKFVLKNLIFDLGKSAIKPAAKQDLNKLAAIMISKPSMRILLEGHTDRRGGARKNQILSEERVKSAKAYLVERGVNSNNIDTKGWGHRKPLIITNDIEKGKINRRVEVQVLSR